MTGTLAEHKLLQQAAAVAKTFKLDPVMVLNAPLFEWQVRVAAHNYIQKVEKENSKNIPKPKRR